MQWEGEIMTRWISLALVITALIIGTLSVYVFQSHTAADSLSTNTSSWLEFTAPEGSFKVLVPSLPHHAKESHQESKSHEMREHELYVSNKDDGTLFTVYLITFPNRTKTELDSKFLLDFIQEMLSSNQDNKIEFIKPVRSNKVSGVEFSVENHEAMVDGKAFIKDNTVYVLSMTAKIDNRDKKEFEFFINSFELGILKNHKG
jgi:hypothetical protein